MVAEYLLDLCFSYFTVSIDIEHSERLVEREGLMAAQVESSIFNGPVLLDQELDQTQEHKVINLTLFLKLVGTFLFLASLLSIGFNLLLNFCALLTGDALLLVAFDLALSWRQVVIGCSALPLGRSFVS